MRIMDEVRKETSSRVFESSQEYSDPGRTYERAAIEDGTAGPDVPRRPFARAVSWLVAHLIEGLAVHGEAIHPSSFDHLDLTNRYEPKRDLELSGSRKNRHRSETRWLNASSSRMLEKSWQSASPRATSLGWSATIASSVSRIWRAQRTGLTITRLHALDDHTLKDIGIHRSQIESVARNLDRYPE